LCFNDLSPETGLALMDKFSIHSAVSFTNPLTHAGYTDIPVSYLFCEIDQVIPPEFQQKGIEIIEAAKAAGETKGEVDITTLHAGHVPHISRPEETVAWIESVVAKT
jgi:hypothetical protein